MTGRQVAKVHRQSMEEPSVQGQAQHFLFVTSPLQGHINPTRRLAARVAAANPGARVTFSTAVSGHRLMFPWLAPSPDGEVSDGVLLYAPYSDGYDEGFGRGRHDEARAREALSLVVARLASRGRPVTRVVYTFLVGWAADVARAHGAAAALFWIQPATVLAVYYHYFHGHGPPLLAACANGSSVVQLPGLPPLASDALPSIVAVTSPEQPLYGALRALRDLFLALDEHRPTVIVNTFDALERDALLAVPRLQAVAVGPVVPPADDEAAAASPSGRSTDDLVERDGGATEEYMGWLDAQAARSVVYVSFGTMLPVSERQELELRRGLESTDRPYLWARKGGGGDQGHGDATGGGERGVVVGWCDQPRVLSHPAVGCFVTHCGWNSALESVARGVPVVAAPQWTDQPTVAWLVAERAGAGVRAAADGQGVVGRDELRRCVEAVMGGGERAVEIRARAEWWMERASEAVASSGASGRNLRAFASGL